MRIWCKDFWKDKRVFLTGHTGFKGSWLSFLLSKLGAKVGGYSLAPNENQILFDELKLSKFLAVSHFADIRDRNALSEAVCSFEPDIAIHMAAQPLVRMAYEDPIETFETNVMGTVNFCHAIRACASLRTALNITTDKVYDNKEWMWSYREIDPLKGKDPYSASKVCSELVSYSYAHSFLDPDKVTLGSARAGNIVGGGDFSSDRLIPDYFKALKSGQSLVLRNPDATRPWQHVLDAINGYLVLIENMHNNRETNHPSVNFGPERKDAITVRGVINLLNRDHNKVGIKIQKEGNPSESQMLSLDCSKAYSKLNWEPIWNINRTIEEVTYWYLNYQNGHTADSLCEYQIQSFQKECQRNKL